MVQSDTRQAGASGSGLLRLHPLEPLTEDEIQAASDLLRTHPDFPTAPADAVFVSMSRLEPSRASLDDAELTGRPPAREALIVLYDRRSRQVIEAAVSLGAQTV